MEIKGLNKINNFLKKAGGLSRSSAFYAKASVVMAADVKNNFKKKKNSDGTTWTSLKFRKGGQPLRRKGKLVNSISNAYDTRNAVAGTNVIYAAVHNFGYKFKPTKKQRGFFLATPSLRTLAFASVLHIPKREYMFLSGEGGKNIEKLTVNVLGGL